MQTLLYLINNNLINNTLTVKFTVSILEIQESKFFETLPKRLVETCVMLVFCRELKKYNYFLKKQILATLSIKSFCVS